MTQLNLPQPNQPQIQEFEFNTNQIRVIDKDGELWFLAPDVCRVLGLSNTTKAMLRLDEDEYALTSIQGITKGNDQVNLINESGLYSLTLGSRKPVAKEFKRWVTHEVLPSIRKTGSYSVNQQPQLDAPLTKDQRKRVAGLMAIFSQHSHYNRMECWQLLHAKFEVNTVEDLKASQYQGIVSWLEEQVRIATPEVDFITRQALAGVKSFTARLTVEEAVSKTAKAVHREFKANIYIVEEKPKHEIAAYLDAMTDSHQKRLNRAGIR